MPKQNILEETKRLIVDGWNGGLTGGELAAMHKLTRNSIMGVLSRARDKGIKVQERQSPLPIEAGVKKAQAKQAGLGRVSGFPDTRRHKPEPSMPPITLEGQSGNQHTHEGVSNDTRAKLATIRKLPAVIVGIDLAAPGGDFTARWVPFMDLQNNAGCRYSLDAKLFCNAPGFPYCPEHKAIVNPPSAQKFYGGRSAGNAQKFT